MRAYLSKEQGRVFGVSFLGVIINVGHSEARSVAVCPFKIIEEAYNRISARVSADIKEWMSTPCKIGLHNDTIFSDRFYERICIPSEIFNPIFIVDSVRDGKRVTFSSEAIFCDAIE